MAESENEQPFARIRAFDWDPKKREQVFKERGIDFDDARHVFAGPLSCAVLIGKAKRAIWCSAFWRT
jgi:uncharacterized DUF497 family protein